jgi:hypothetical protein
VSFVPLRDANPFLHLIESIWMLAGRNDVESIGYYAKQLLEYTDDGVTLNGAYGHRWRTYFGYDQLLEVVNEIRRNQGSRRCVISMWNGMDIWGLQDNGMPDEPKLVHEVTADLVNQESKDLPCNLQVIVDPTQGKLDITVTNRSNDMIWGAYGANAVHFAFLQELLANLVGLPVGTYYQMSNNLHVYTEFEITKRFLTKLEDGNYWFNGFHFHDEYASGLVTHKPLNADITTLTECHQLIRAARDYTIENYKSGYETFSTHERENQVTGRFLNDFLHEIVVPMAAAYNEHKQGRTQEALDFLLDLSEVKNDWIYAGRHWLQRRLDNKRNKEQTNVA